jgi:hypothetical protein
MKRRILQLLFIVITASVNAQTVVTLNLPNPCASVDIKEAVKSEFGIKISPNPTLGKFSIQISNKESIGKAKIEITNMLGAVVLSEQIYSKSLKCIKTFDLSNLPKGVYLISVSINDRRETKRLVIN